MVQFGLMAVLISTHAQVLQSYSQALPIHATSGRKWEPEYDCSLNGSRDDDWVEFYCSRHDSGALCRNDSVLTEHVGSDCTALSCPHGGYTTD